PAIYIQIDHAILNITNSQMLKCKGTTRAGNQCKKCCVMGKNYCNIHLKEISVEEEKNIDMDGDVDVKWRENVSSMLRMYDETLRYIDKAKKKFAEYCKLKF